MNAANESEFWPPVFSNTEFRAWAHRTLNHLHMAAGCGEHAMEKIFMFEGVPPNDWAAGLAFVARSATDDSLTVFNSTSIT